MNNEMARDLAKASSDVAVADKPKSLVEALEDMEQLYKGGDNHKERCHRKNRNTKHKAKMKKASRKKNRR